MSSIALDAEAEKKARAYRPLRIWVARGVFAVLVLASVVLTFIDGPDLQGHHYHPAHGPLHSLLVLLFLCTNIVELEMEVHWLKRHPEAR